jgi:hypothetical protein
MFLVHLTVIAETRHYEVAEGYLESTNACYINSLWRTSELPNADIECTCDFVITNKGYNVWGDQWKVFFVEFIARD